MKQLARDAVLNFLAKLKADQTGKLKQKCCDPKDPHDTAKTTFLAAGG